MSSLFSNLGRRGLVGLPGVPGPRGDAGEGKFQIQSKKYVSGGKPFLENDSSESNAFQAF